MASAKRLTLAAASFLLMATILLGASLAVAGGGGVVHNVGWTTFMDYNKWVSSNNFHVGDNIVFNYNNQSHNVKQVTLQDFQSCNAASPISTFTTGSDSVSLKRAGHYYFLCGYPGHCEAGQKIDITVTPTSLRPISAPMGTPLPSSASSTSSSPNNLDETNASSLFKLCSPFLFFAVLEFLDS